MLNLLLLEKEHVPCHNLSLGFMTKARACECVGQEGSPGVTFHALESARECEGMNPHCHNLSFGLATKVKGLQGCGPRGSPGVTS
jgi:hypothetical protein